MRVPRGFYEKVRLETGKITDALLNNPKMGRYIDQSLDAPMPFSGSGGEGEQGGIL